MTYKYSNKYSKLEPLDSRDLIPFFEGWSDFLHHTIGMIAPHRKDLDGDMIKALLWEHLKKYMGDTTE